MESLSGVRLSLQLSASHRVCRKNCLNGKGNDFVRACYLTVGTLLWLLWSNCCATSFAEEAVLFSRDVLPILADRCFHCHGPDETSRQADLRLDDREVATSLGAIVPEDPDGSELIVRITSEDADLRMPPSDSHRKQLSDAEVAILRRWIAEGAVWGKHWAFEKPQRPIPPDETVNPIDAFVAKRLAKEGLELSPEADRRTLVRRVTLDLTGLPPTSDEVAAFLADDSADAYERLVDRLLASPHYGERMAWEWLDAARYADTAGYQGDPERTMWPWRDWLIGALNNNMPFDEFTTELLAGDLLPNATPEQRLATGFNRNHAYNSEGGRIAEETRVENVFDRTDTTGTIWLGLTLQCARCHDHKFDPTTSKDYFAFSDFFNQTSEAGLEDHCVAVPPAMDYEVPGAGTVKVMVMDTCEQRRTTHVLSGGIYDNPTDVQVAANVPRMLPPLPKKSTHEPYNRLDLARWLVSPENPLTARVTVNRYWQTFFGRGIVATPGDFGLQGTPPTHPDLLDWLAVEFIESGWDVKHIHKLIVTSETYRQDARISARALERDPSNALLSHGPRFRMPSWMIRDHALAASGLLVPTIGGPPIRPYQPDGIWEEATFGLIEYQPDTGDKLYRRSIYVFWRRIVGPTMFFDAARRQTCEVTPSLTNTPLHALTTLNDITYVEAARVLAEQLLKSDATTEQRIDKAFQALTARPADDAELALLVERHSSYVEQFRKNPDDAAKLVATGQAPRDSTLDPAEFAAYTTLVNTLMNLDETLVRP